MKHKLITLSSILLLSSPCFASVSFQIEADLLKNDAGTAIGQSSLFLLVSSTTDSTFDAITADSSTAVGSLLNSNDRVLFKGDLSSFGTDGVLQASTGPLFLNSGSLTNWTTGDPLALLWFPTLTTSSTTIPAGTKYGLYTNSNAVDGSSAWVTPTDPSTDYTLLFYTQDGSEFGSAGVSNPAAAGNASFTVGGGGVVPEPSRMMLGLFGFLGLALRRRR